jgi:hypothetical protein
MTKLVLSEVQVTECSPAKLGDVISNACRILGNASIELARRRMQPASDGHD